MNSLFLIVSDYDKLSRMYLSDLNKGSWAIFWMSGSFEYGQDCIPEESFIYL